MEPSTRSPPPYGVDGRERRGDRTVHASCAWREAAPPPREPSTGGAVMSGMAGSDGALGDEPRAEAVEKALGRAYRYLGHRDRSVAEVRKHLLLKEVDADVVDAVLEELERQGYLDDARFAERFADDKRRLEGWGPDRIARKLAEAGVARAHVDAVLAQRDGEDELRAAVALLERKLREPPADDRAKERALGFLIRKGYDLELAHDAIRAFR